MVTMTSFTKRICNYVAIVLCLGLLTAHPAIAESSGIGGRPANPDPSNERSKSIFIKQLDPGQTASDAVKIINNSDSAKKIMVYATDSVASSGGAFACAQAADTPSAVGSWIKLDRSSVSLKAGESVDVPFSISVPRQASVGEQNGCIVLQEDKEASVQSGIGLSFRTAIRVAILVPGDIHKQLVADGLELQQKNDTVTLSPQVKNTGNVSLDTDVESRISSIFGTTVAEQKNNFPILRDQITRWNFEFNKPFWGGFYTASYKLKFDANPSQYLGAGSANSQAVVGPSKLFFATPAPAALAIELVVLALLIGLIIWLYRRSRHTQAVREDWSTYTVRVNDDIQTIAKAYHVSWRKLAAANSLKPPFTLKTGDKIKTPPLSKKVKTPGQR